MKANRKSAASARRGATQPQLSLKRFLPYQLAVVAETVSREISRVYREKYELSRDEWRVLALLGEVGSVKTRDARRYTTLDKVQISRAINSMLARGLLVRRELAEDRRNHVIELTRQGMSLYRKLVPEVLAVETAIISRLDQNQLNSLSDALEQLLPD